MQEVKVNKKWLKEVLLENREKHREEYLKAFEGYRSACIEALEENLEALKKGKFRRVMIMESAPEDHTKDYDLIISMLDASVDEEITLLSSEYNNYVRDEWGWSQMWKASNTKYLS